MYNIIVLCMGILMLILGTFMFINSKGSTKKELREDSNAVAKTKKSGIIVIICGIVAVASEIILMFVL